MDLTIPLSHLGLTEKESKIYLTLLEHGHMTGYELAGFLGTKPPATYYNLEELRKKGLVNKIPYPSKQVFSAKDPREVVSLRHAQLSEVESVLPHLLALANVVGRPQVKFFEGIEGCRQACDTMLTYAKNSEVVGFYMYKDNISEDQLKNDIYYKKALINKGATLRGLTPYDKRLKTYIDQNQSHPYFDIRFLPRDMYFPEASIETVGPAVLIASFDMGQNLVIENPEIARSVRQIFELVWKYSELIETKTKSKK